MTDFNLQGHGLYNYEVKDKNNLIFLAFAIKERKEKTMKDIVISDSDIIDELQDIIVSLTEKNIYEYELKVRLAYTIQKIKDRQQD